MNRDYATQYRRKLLADIGLEAPLEVVAAPQQQDRERWHESGLAVLAGAPGHPLLTPPLPLASLADGALAAFAHVAARALPYKNGGADLLTLRAATMGLTARGPVSPNGCCRLLETQDGMIALNLSRPGDWDLLDAWLRKQVAPTWPALAAGARRQDTRELVDQGRLLGLAVADAQTPAVTNAPWLRTCHCASPAQHPRNAALPAPRVVDLSSLWAGPLCSRLLAWAGCEVTKVESLQRPDGARQSSKEFFDFLNRGKRRVSLDFSSTQGMHALRRLLAQADIIIEGSRPRALRQLGIHAEQVLDARPGTTWISITGYGRQEPQANWIAYGDDAGVAAGLSASLHAATGRWLICGDAIADPFTGLHAALAALASLRAGGGKLLSLSLVDTVRHGIEFAMDSAA